MADIVLPGAPVGGTLNSDALPNNYNMEIYKGDYVEFFVVLKDSLGVPLNLVGTTPKAQLKSSYDEQLGIDFTCTLTGQPGEVRVFLASAATSALLPSSYIWDFQVTNTLGQTRTYLAGDVTVHNEVTT